jgi:ketosteroid isomerase-like protein
MGDSMSGEKLASREEEIVHTVERLVDALNRGDMAAARSVFTDNGAVWHNFDQVAMPCETALAVVEGAAGMGFHYDIVWRHVVDDGCVQQHVVRGPSLDGKLVEVPAMWRVVYAGDRIERIDEYVDSTQAAEILAAAASR